MRWIKASERLPDKDGQYFCRWSDRHDLKMIGQYLLKHGEFDINTGSFSLEWLDESPDAAPESREELWEEAKKEFSEYKNISIQSVFNILRQKFILIKK